MPRARIIKPGFFKNFTLAQLTYQHRLLFAGLWTLADREGRLKDDPAWIRAELFPYEPHVNVDVLLTDLQQADFIVRYTYEDLSKTSNTSKTRATRSRAIAIPTFLHHQNPHHRERPSTIPPPTSRRSPPRSVASTRARAKPCLAQGSAVPSREDPVTGDPVPKDQAAAPTPQPLPLLREVREDPQRNVSVITRVVHETLDLVGPQSSRSDLTEAVKSRCAQLRIAYDGLAVGKAIDSALHQRNLRRA